MKAQITRRAALGAAGGALALSATTLPAIANASIGADPDAHIHRLAATFTKAWDSCEAYPGEMEEPGFDALMDAGNAAYYEIMESEPQTVAGLEAKYRTFHRWISGSMIEQEQIDVFAADLRRMAGVAS